MAVNVKITAMRAIESRFVEPMSGDLSLGFRKKSPKTGTTFR